VRKEVTVAASAARAFRAFTEGMNDWWSREHHWGTSPLKRQVLEAKTGGRWYSVSEDGTARELGRVTACETPRRVVIGCHDLTANGRVPDPALETEIEVTFSESEGRTVVRLEHRQLERYGDLVSEVRGHLDAVIGWQATLDDFAKGL
jgi:uncharacterized protein YndB with AHSA1/START domain